jgi:glycosyltransferase involved in cell wall biosynthesis
MSKPHVIAFAVCPPPVTGLHFLTERYIAITSTRLDWRIKDCGKPTLDKRKGQFGRLGRNLYAGLSTALGSKNGIAAAYTPVNAGPTMIYNIGLALVCRMRGIPMLVHHHSYYYLNHHYGLAAWLNRFLGPNDGHIFLSETMRQAYDSKYRRRAQSVVLPNSYSLPPIENTESSSSKSGVFRIGHLCNLSIEKGLKTVIDVFTELLKTTPNAELHLAGPVAKSRERDIIADAERRLGPALKVHGPLYGEDKHKFFRNIDVFWFPTEYLVEAQPVVLLEALAHGVPSVSIRRGCIEWLLGSAGFVAGDPTEFRTLAFQSSKDLMNESTYASARLRCRDRLDELKRIDKFGMEASVKFLSGERIGDVAVLKSENF